jgi:hypothetical protein
MDAIDLKAFEYAISKIDDGFLFEDFGKSFLSSIFGYKFIPVGGTKDKGIDAFFHIYSREDREKIIFQFSTELGAEDKIRSTLKKLTENKIDYDQLFYVTSRAVTNKDIISERLSDEFDKPVTIYDNTWLKTYANYNQTTISAYNIFIDSHLHVLIKPHTTVVVGNLESDARIYIYLREQLVGKGANRKLEESLADALIIFSLEGTNPESEIFKTATQIKENVRHYIKFEPTILDKIIDDRLEYLTTKPRKIQYHTKGAGYCLPYETRLEIRDRDIKDAGLLDTFISQTEITLKYFLKEEGAIARNLSQLIENVIREIYFQQGLEFANFVVNGESKSVIEKELVDIIGLAVDKSPIVLKNKEKVKVALLMTIREMVYNGSPEQKHYLKCLSNTYLMMFMLQCDPKLALYFETLASKLNVYVCTSIIIPALSEIYLDRENKRHWNLLIGSHETGIKLIVNDTIIGELIKHFNMVINKYHSLYKYNEDVLIDDEIESMYVDEIMIRAYFYAKKENRVRGFDDFINNFLDPSLKTAKDDLVSFLHEVFGIDYVPDSHHDVRIDQDEWKLLTEKLKDKKSHAEKAENDARLILTIYKLREKYNETASSGIFGYKTWWLSKDTTTFKAVIEAFGEDKYPVSCYIRPDFIYNYITLKPKQKEIEETYDSLFPSLLGVNISYHLAPEIAEMVQVRLKEHADKPPARLKSIVRQLSEQLKSDPTIRNRKSIKLFLDEKLEELSKSMQ